MPLIPIDSNQVSRIEGVHRGFLYQHLYAVSCLLQAGPFKYRSIVVEHDEDVQVQTDSSWIYIQIKTRQADTLPPSAVEGILDRFRALRQLHQSAQRQGAAQFFVVANKPPSENLQQEIDDSWPSDIRYLHPNSAKSTNVPHPWMDLPQAVSACQRLAEKVQHTPLSPTAIAWKLAAFIMFVSSGRGGGKSHRIEAGELPLLLEQFTAQLHRIPSLPTMMRDTDIPFNIEISGVSIIGGYPGSGKTTWAARMCQHSPRLTVYFDAAWAPTEQFTSSLSREVFATINPRLGQQGPNKSSVFTAGRTSRESLLALSHFATQSISGRILIVVDNAHAAQSGNEIIAAAKTCSGFDWLILGHPGEEINLIAESCETDIKLLKGWTQDSVGAELSSQDIHHTVDDIVALTTFTEGNPLFTRSLITLTQRHYDRNLSSCLVSISNGLHPSLVAQERILGPVLSHFDEQTLNTIALLSRFEFYLVTEVLIDAATSLEIPKRQAASIFRELSEWSIIESLGQALRLRDAYRPLAAERLSSLPNERVRHASIKVTDFLHRKMLAQKASIEDLLLYIRLLPVVGKVKDLIGIATSDDEFFIEIGVKRDAEVALGKCVDDDGIEIEERAMALDTLAFWSLHDDNLQQAEAYIDELARLVQSPKSDPERFARLVGKRLLLAGKQKHWRIAMRAANSVLKNNELDEQWHNITVYNLAVCALSCRQLHRAEPLAQDATQRYLRAAKLDLMRDLFAENPPEIAQRIKRTGVEIHVVKKLADALYLLDMVSEMRGKVRGGLLKIQAHKLYLVAEAYASAVRTGQDVVDSMIAVGDISSARALLEGSLLRVADFHSATETQLSLRSQHAVVLAYCGEIESAKEHIRAVWESYGSALQPDKQSEVMNQIELINQIAEGLVDAPKLVEISAEQVTNIRRALGKK